MKKIILLLLVGLLAGNFSLFAQQLDHAQGEILIKTEDKGNLKNALRDLARIDGAETGLTIKKVVVKSQNMYLLGFDHAAVNEQVVLQKLARHHDILTAQFNHFIDLRLEPNDPEFGDQWQYINNGQDGGTVGADIDMDLAWDITTGGVTPNGDTIVVAALDDGIDLNHTDFEDNRWRNWAEIPDNGIDDDNNGYIDDFEGWNSNADNDNIAGGGHGTPVAGIIGAKGNNEIGVAGVSWNVKVMVIKNDFNTSEAGVLSAYGYALAQRELYNETDGEEGTFVVSTNASWGVDGGQPDDAPLWCGFYDILGEAGILNCGATINGNQNVDTFGDLPTACPSDYMISVTNMNRNDNKVTQAGFGLETIDLGAFGADTWTTALGGGYAGFGGTSGATPHVAGTIGLLYSAPCSNLADLAMNDPAAAALAVRSYVLDGVDPNESLEGITVTGGRLNVRNSLDLLLAECGPCPPPSALEALNLTAGSADLTWISNENSTLDTLQYRAVGDEDWTTIADATAPYSLTDLLTCTEYEFRVKSSCPEEDSGYSTPRIFTTDGCCEAPQDLTITQNDDGSYLVSWMSVTAASSYTLEYGITGGDELFEVTDLTELTFTVADLEECASYDFSVTSVCDGQDNVTTEPFVLVTEGCGACTENDYCDRPVGETADEWIESISIDGVLFESGDNGGEAAFFGNPAIFDAAATTEMIFTPAYSGNTFPEFFTVFIDLNQDGTFSADELLFTSPEAVTAAETATIEVPATALNGVTRMRVRMLWNNAGTDPCFDGFHYGETEDYCVEIVNAGLEPCAEATDFSASALTQTTATLAWTGSSAAESYTVEILDATGEIFLSEVVAPTQIEVINLEPCQSYTASVVAVCAENNISEIVETTFMTECPLCPEVTALDSMMTTENSITLTWDFDGEAENFNVLYAPADGGAVTAGVFDTAPVTISGLDFCTEYRFEVSANCVAGNESELVEKNISTSCVSSVTELPGDADALRLFPNPFTDRLQLEINLTAASDRLDIEILNAAGQTVGVQKIERLAAGRHILPIDIASESAGVFFVRIATEGGSTVRRVVRTL